MEVKDIHTRIEKFWEMMKNGRNLENEADIKSFQEFIEKALLKKPYYVYGDEPLCPSCHEPLDGSEEHCELCDQRIDWSEDNEKYYLAYGSNIGYKEMSMRCPNSVQVAKGFLKDYKLEFRGGGAGFLTIKENKGTSIPVSLWKVGKYDKQTLDCYESLGSLYYIKEIVCEIEGKQYECFAYIMLEKFKESMPTECYVRRCKEMYEEEGFGEVIDILDNALQKCKKGGKHQIEHIY